MRKNNLLFLLLLSTSCFVSCASPASIKGNTANATNETEVVTASGNSLDGVNLVGKVAFKNYENYIKEESSQEEEENDASLALNIFPFDSVILKESVFFQINVPEEYNSHGYLDLTSVCGNGMLNVIYGGVSLLKDDANFINADYVAVNGSKGTYCFLLNSQNPIYENKDVLTGYENYYSSHVTITMNGIEKKFSSPYDGIRIYTSTSEFNFARNNINIVSENDYLEDYALKPIGEVIHIPESSPYSVSDIITDFINEN